MKNIKPISLLLTLLVAAASVCYADRGADFFVAVRSGDRDEVKRMIAKDKTLVFITDRRGMTPFLTAVESRDLEMTYLLADYFSRLGDSSTAGNAMHIAVNNEDEPMLRLLVRLAADEDPDMPRHLINMPRMRENAPRTSVANDRNTPLHLAAKKCNFQIYKYLLDHGANPKARNAAGKTPAQLLSVCPKPKPAAKKAAPKPAPKPKPVEEPITFPIL